MPVVADTGIEEACRNRQVFVDLAAFDAEQAAAGEAFWQGLVESPGKEATCSHHREAARDTRDLVVDSGKVPDGFGMVAQDNIQVLQDDGVERRASAYDRWLVLPLPMDSVVAENMASAVESTAAADL